jgi:cytochrome c553
MKTTLLFVMGLLLAPWQLAFADAPMLPKSPIGYGSKGYVWGKMIPERAAILEMSGDAERGKEAFRGCRGCHKNDAAGLIDGTYPRLTGQHASVIIKQVTEVRAGIRINPKMEPFSAQHAISLQEIADIAVYVEGLDSPRENGKGPGDIVDKGKKLYVKANCAKCHGEKGEGNADKAYPAIAAQHYGYLTRELEYIQKGIRGNSHPDMIKAIKKYKHDDLEAISDYLSRLPDYRTVKQ